MTYCNANLCPNLTFYTDFLISLFMRRRSGLVVTKTFSSLNMTFRIWLCDGTNTSLRYLLGRRKNWDVEIISFIYDKQFASIYNMMIHVFGDSKLSIRIIKNIIMSHELFLVSRYICKLLEWFYIYLNLSQIIYNRLKSRYDM